MNDFQRIFDEMLHDASTLKDVMIKVIVRKLEKQGVTLDDEQHKKLESALDNIDLDGETISIDLEDIIFDESQVDFDLDLDQGDEFNEVLSEITENFAKAIPEIISETSDGILESLKQDAPRMLAEHNVLDSLEAGLTNDLY